MLGRVAVALALAPLLLGGCSDSGSEDRTGVPDDVRTARTPSHQPTPAPVVPVPEAPGSTARTHAPRPPTDPRWVFYTKDSRLRSSPWFRGRHRVMIPFGCTPAPYYHPDPSCPAGQGKHHGIDVAMPCGTPLFAGRAARVLDGATLGSAYGASPVLLRIGDQDVVIGHTRRVFVVPGERLAAGERFALAGDSGAPDGCHLHFEVRPAGAGYLSAVDPAALLALS